MSDQSYEYDLPPVIEVEADGPIRIVRLNRPEQLNATNHELHSGLAALFPQLDADAEARVAVITGNGRAFSAGGDFSYIDELAKDANLRNVSLTHGRQIVTGMVGCRVPVVASVEGFAIGAAWGLVLACDLVVASRDAFFAAPFNQRGLVADAGLAWALPRHLGHQRAAELLLLGERLPAPRAPLRHQSWGE